MPPIPASDSCAVNRDLSSEEEKCAQKEKDAMSEINPSTPVKNLLTRLKTNINITELNLTGCDLTELPQNIMGLDCLVNLNLSHNKLNALPPQFNLLNKIRKVNLSHNEFVEAPSCLFKGMRLVNEIDLSYNKLAQFNLAPLCIVLLRVLKLNNNLMKCIPFWFYREIPACLSHVDLSNNHHIIYELTLYSSNQITRVCDGIKYINLSQCGFHDRNIFFLKDFPNLYSLNLGNDDADDKQGFKVQNNFQCIPVKFLNCLNTLRELRIQNVCLPLIEDNISKLVNLRILDIANNIVNWLPVGVCELCKLEKLVLSNCGLYFLPPEINNLKQLREVYLDGNELTSLPETFVELTNLTVLDLFNNSLTKLPDFNSLKSLEALDICMNFLDTPDYIMIHEETKSYKEMRSFLLSNYVSMSRKDERKFAPPEISTSIDPDKSFDTDSLSEEDVASVEYNYIEDEAKDLKEGDEWDCGTHSNFCNPYEASLRGSFSSCESVNLSDNLEEKRHFFQPYKEQIGFWSPQRCFIEIEEGQFDDC